MSDSLRKALAYLPRDAVLVALVSTDVERGPLARLDRQAAQSRAWARLKQRLESDVEEELDYQRELRPQLGAPLAVASGPGEQEEYSALLIPRPSRLRAQLRRSVRRGDLRRLGTHKGAPLLRARRTPGEGDEGFLYSAVHGRVWISGDSEAQLRRAIDRSVGDDNLAASGSLPEGVEEPARDVVLSAAGNGRELIAALDEQDARPAGRLPWLRALGHFEVTGTVRGAEVRFDLELRTDGTQLSEEHLPLPPGRHRLRQPRGSGVLLMALAGPEHAVRFIESIVRASDPKTFREYRESLRGLEQTFGLDVHRDLLAKVRDVAFGLRNERDGSFVARLDDGSGSDFADALDRAALFVQSSIQQDVKDAELIEGRNDTWTVREGGRTLATYSVRGDALVGGIGRPLPSPNGGVNASSGGLAMTLDTEWAARSTEPDENVTRDDLDLISRLGLLRMRFENTTDVLRGEARFVFAP